MKTKALISFAFTVKLICVFVFAYAKHWFSHDVAHISLNNEHFEMEILEEDNYSNIPNFEKGSLQ